jgi:trehalose 6-phosphate phosphatase
VLDVDATVSALAERPEQTALLVDFDGSLSQIVERPEDARPLPGVVEVLTRLASRLGRVGVVSGRPVGFLVEQLPVPGALYVGLYGMELVRNGERTVDARVVEYLGAAAAAVAELSARLPAELVEPKSGVSVTLHWRPAPERAEELLAVATEVAAKHNLMLLRTRMAVELRPPVAIDKGESAYNLVSGFATAAFAGDDTGDLPAFAALARAESTGALRRAIRIGVLSPEAPPELRDAVDVTVDGPPGLLALLARVADEIV